MLFFSLLVALALSLAAAVDDFDNVRNGYEFIYHDNHDLLLTLHDNKCYYTNVPDSFLVENLLIDGDFLLPGLNAREASEDLIIQSIEDGQAIHASSLDAVRDRFGDLLADFHCNGKQVFEFIWHPSGGGGGSHHETHRPHHGGDRR